MPNVLTGCRDVSVCDLNGVERFVVSAIRWLAAAHENEGFAVTCLRDSFDRAGLHHAWPAFERFIDAACSTPIGCPSVQRLGCRRLSSFEAHSLHAIACLQCGIVGEAWKSMVRVCSRRQASLALEHLQEVAVALSRIGGRVERWRFEDEGVAAGPNRRIGVLDPPLQYGFDRRDAASCGQSGDFEAAAAETCTFSRIAAARQSQAADAIDIGCGMESQKLIVRRRPGAH